MKSKQFSARVFALLFALLLLFGVVAGGQGILSAFAAGETKYSNVLDDLKKDEDFNAEKYPDDASDLSIKFIQIAESEAHELFIYTYQPAQKTRYLVAQHINMSLAPSVDDGKQLTDDTKLYELKLLSSSGVFCKYLVKGVTVSVEPVRYYNISSITRRYLAGIDPPPVGDNKTNETAFKVGWCWKAETDGDSVTYSADATEVITVLDEYRFTIAFSEGFQWGGSDKEVDAHFIAFNTDKPMDWIESAYLEFYTRDYSKVEGQKEKLKDSVPHSVTLTDEQVFKKKGAEIDRIQRVDDFLNDYDYLVNDEVIQYLAGTTWVFDFYETTYQRDFGGSSFFWLFVPFYGNLYRFWKDALTTRGTYVEKVSILRLEYNYQGDYYNVGVVSNVGAGSNKPVNPKGEGFWAWLAGKLHISTGWLTALAIIIPLVILLPIFAAAFPAFGKILLSILKCIWLVISWPFIKIAEAIRKRKEKKKTEAKA